MTLFVTPGFMVFRGLGLAGIETTLPQVKELIGWIHGKSGVNNDGTDFFDALQSIRCKRLPSS